MLDFQQKRKVRSMAYHKVTLVLLGIVVIFGIRSVWMVYQKENESAELLRMSRERVAELSGRESQLQSQISKIQTDQGLEAEIRSKFNVAKPDEQVAVIVDTVSATTATSTQYGSVWRKILHELGIIK